jgi:hypothetical protein
LYDADLLHLSMCAPEVVASGIDDIIVQTGRDSSLGWTVYGVTDLGMLDLRELIGGNSYTLQTQLNIKGFTFHTHALSDTRANGFLFINSELAALFTRHCGARFKPLSYTISVTGYNSKGNSRITHYIRLTLRINNRWFVRMPFCIALLRKHNIIIGYKWLKYFKINLIVIDRKLLWP